MIFDVHYVDLQYTYLYENDNFKQHIAIVMHSDSLGGNFKREIQRTTVRVP